MNCIKLSVLTALSLIVLPITSHATIDLVDGINTRQEFDTLIQSNTLFDNFGQISGNPLGELAPIKSFYLAVNQSPNAALFTSILEGAFDVSGASLNEEEVIVLLENGFIYDVNFNPKANSLRELNLIVDLFQAIDNAPNKDTLNAALREKLGIDRLTTAIDSPGKYHDLFNRVILNAEGAAKPISAQLDSILTLQVDEVDKFITALNASSQVPALQQFIQDIFDVDLKDGASALERQILINADVITEENGTPKDHAQTIAIYEEILDHVNDVHASDNPSILISLALEAFDPGIDLVDGINTRQEFDVLIQSGTLLDANGDVTGNPLAELAPVRAFYEAVNESDEADLFLEILDQAFDVSGGSLNENEVASLVSNGFIFDSSFNVKPDALQELNLIAALFNAIDISPNAANLNAALLDKLGIDRDNDGIDSAWKFHDLFNRIILTAQGTAKPINTQLETLLNLQVDEVDKFISALNSSNDAVLLQKFVLDIFEVDLRDGASALEREILEDEEVVVDNDGDPRDHVQTIAMYEEILDHVNDVNTSINPSVLISLAQAAYNPGIDLIDGINTRQEYDTLLESGTLLDNQGEVTGNPLAELSPVKDFYQQVNASLHSSLFLEILDNAFNVSGGSLNEDEVAALLENGFIFDEDFDPKNDPLRELNQIAALFNAIDIAPNATALNVALRDKLGIDRANNGIDSAWKFHDLFNRVILTPQGTPKPLNTQLDTLLTLQVDEVDKFITILNTSPDAPMLQKFVSDIFGINLRDGASAQERQVLIDEEVVVDANGTPKDHALTVALYEAILDHVDDINTSPNPSLLIGLAQVAYNTGTFLEGDVDLDNAVGLSDFNIMKANFGRVNATRSQGDVSGDGNVDLSDFNVLKANFGRSASEDLEVLSSKQAVLQKQFQEVTSLYASQERLEAPSVQK